MGQPGRVSGAQGGLSAGLVLAVLAGVHLVAQPVVPQAQAPGSDARVLVQDFEAPPDEARVLMRWWWFGPSVTTDGLDRDLRAMRDAGLGGVEVQPVYPLALDDAQTGARVLPYLSPAFLDVLTHARGTAGSLGLRFDVTLGSGWPFGGPTVTASDAAGALRVARLPHTAGSRAVGLPTLEAGERYLAAYLTPGPSEPADPGAFTRLDLARARDGVVALPAPLVRDHIAWVFIESRTGMMVKRPAVGAEGFVLNHYDRSALRRYLESVGTPLLGALASSRPYAIFCDSLEVFGSDWSTGLTVAFQQRYGYDLRDHLPALLKGDDQRSRGVRHDWGQLLTERLETEFLEPLTQWAHEHDTRLRVQAYGIPPARPSSAGLIDLPEGEGAAWRTVSATRWASSAAHVFGRPVASSEAWTWLHSPSFAATPLDVKAEADLHFLQGITQLIGHGWPNTPPGVEWPGARFYAASVLSDANPWWIVMPDVARYLQRTSAMLREGQPVSDVALYLPVSEAWSRMQPGRVHLFEMLRDHVGPAVVASLLDGGFAFDVVDDRELVPSARIEGRDLVVGRARYRAVVLPNVTVMPPQTLDLLTAFARAGGLVVASRRAPSEAPGFRSGVQQHGHVARAAATLFGGGGVTRPLGLLAPTDEAIGATLASRITPAVRWGSDAAVLGFIQRRVGGVDLFFVANTTNRAITTTAALRTAASRAESWDLVNGTRHALAGTRGGEGLDVRLTLAPYASAMLVAGDDLPGGVGGAACPASGGEMDLSTGWQLEVPGQPARRLDALASWHERTETRFFSGVATYTRDLEITQSVLEGRCPVWLDFGEGTARATERLTNGMRTWLDAPVRDGARVIVNGRDMGAVWAPPFRLDIRSALRPGANQLSVRVGNTALNQWAARPQPDYRLLHLRYGKRFDPQDIDQVTPQPSGIVGRVRIIH